MKLVVQPHRKPLNTMPEILQLSIVIITRNRAQMLAETLDALRLQTVSPAEIIVVDTSDNEATQQMLAEHYPEVRPVVHPFGPRNMSWSRNQGIQAGRAPIVAFLDDDSIAEPQWVAEIARAYEENPEAGGVGGRIIEGLASPVVLAAGQKVTWIDHRGMTHGNFNTLTDGIVETGHLKGCNMSFRRAVLTQIGNFDEAYNGPVRDETDVCVRVTQAGYMLLFNPNATVEHKGFTLYAQKRVQIETVQSGFLVARLDGYYVAKNFGAKTWLAWYLHNGSHTFARAIKISYMVFARAVLSFGGGVTGFLQAYSSHLANTNKYLFPEPSEHNPATKWTEPFV